VVVNAIFDAWTPARAYQHSHAGVRILTETASARLATPVEVPFDSLRGGRDFDPREASWRFPEPWPGGEWRLADIVDYMEAGTLALLKQAALYRERWLRNFYQIGLRAIGGREGWPRAFLIPAAGQNAGGLAELLRVLVTGDVEVRRAEAEFVVGERRYESGTYVIAMAQPYSSFAKALLEVQRYPAISEEPGGALREPYDATAHTLPLLMGVEVVASAELPDVALSAPVAAPAARKQVRGLSGRERPRIAIYEPWVPSIDAGWTRWLFDEYEIAYELLRDAEARAGALAQRYDAIILPDAAPGALLEGHRPGAMPPQFVGGLGQEGVRALDEFVQAGGTLIAFNRASLFAIQQMKLPVVNVLEGLERKEFYGPGSILRLQLRAGHALTAGMPTRSIAWFEQGPAFAAANGAGERVEIVGRFGRDGDLLLSGWLTGGARIAAQGALAEVKHGRGRVVLFGFRPQYRGQAIATYPLIFNALKSAAGTGTASGPPGAGAGS
jgi:hypothetical protein